MPSMKSGTKRLDCVFNDFTITGYRENVVFAWFGNLRPAHEGVSRGVSCEIRTATPDHRSIRMTHGGPKNTEPILILDFGSQYAQLIARRVREAGAFSLLVAPRDTTRDPAIVVAQGCDPFRWTVQCS